MMRVFVRTVIAGILATAAFVVTFRDAAAADASWMAVRQKDAIGGAILQTNNPGSVAVFDVMARRFSVWYMAGPRSGRVAVYVNGARVRNLDQWSSDRERRSIVLEGSRPVNTIMLVALGTKRTKSKDTVVNIDAISPQAKACAKGCLRTPAPTRLLGSLSELATDPVWYPTSVPAREDALHNVAIGSYVRGQDVLPFESNAPRIRAAMCAKAQRVPRGVVILSFGRQVEGGASGFGMALSATDIAATTATVAAGLAECATGPWEVAIGTSNSGGATPFNGFDGGVVWAQIVEQARAVSDPRVTISGAVDIEPSWGPVGQARAWVGGFVASTGRRLWNFGSADGCPQTVGSLRCNNGWTVDDVLWVSSQASPNLVVIPQIHTRSGSQARQWAVIAARGLQVGSPLQIAGVGTQPSACLQVSGGCPTTGNDPWTGWLQLRQALDAIPETAGTPIGPPRDIRWSWQ